MQPTRPDKFVDFRLWALSRRQCLGECPLRAPGADQALSQLLQLPRDKCDLPGQKPAARMSAAKSASGAMKSVPDVATLILATLTGAVGYRRIQRPSPHRHC